MVTPTSHRVPTPDGEQVPVFVYRPADGGDGSAVLVIHGGPESQAVRQWNSFVVAMVAQGHTVVVPNVRGSTGYGKRWYSLDDVRRRLDSVADLAAIHDWLPTLGLDPTRAALYGGSYGGYMVLAGLAFQPERWAAGIDIVGIASLVTFLENTSSYRRSHREREYGHPRTRPGVPAQASPLTRIDADPRTALRDPRSQRPAGSAVGGRADRRRPAGQGRAVRAPGLPRRGTRARQAGEPARRLPSCPGVSCRAPVADRTGTRRHMSERVGFVGLGIMGAGMAGNLVRAGFDVVVYNRTGRQDRAARRRRCRGGGLTACRRRTLRRGLHAASVTHPTWSRCCSAPDGIAEGVDKGSLVVDSSTVSPEATRGWAAQLAERGVGFLDAPVSGGSEGAAKGTLSIMIGGEEVHVDRARRYLDAMGSTITHVGGVGAGQTCKLVNQILVVVSMLGVAEALVFAKAGGLDLEKTIAAVEGGAAGSWMLANRGPQVIRDDWRPGFTIDLQQKDLRLVLDAADQLGVPTIATSTIFHLYRVLQQRRSGRARETTPSSSHSSGWPASRPAPNRTEVAERQVFGRSLNIQRCPSRSAAR